MGRSNQSRAWLSLCRRRIEVSSARLLQGGEGPRPDERPLPLQKVSDGSHPFHEEMRAVELPVTHEVVLAAVACADPPEVES